MKAAIIADIHENYHNLTLFLLEMRKNPVDRIFFLGDFCNAGLALTLAEFEIPVHGVWGNNDGDRAGVMRVAHREGSRLTMAADCFDTVEWGGKRIFLTHYPQLGAAAAASGEFQAVFYGHNHRQHRERVGDCLLANPGELSAHKTGTAGYALYDTDTNDCSLHVVPGEQVTVLTPLVREFRKTINFNI